MIIGERECKLEFVSAVGLSDSGEILDQSGWRELFELFA